MTNGIEITDISQFAGVKFRSPEAWEYSEMFNCLGAVPTPMPFTEMYQAVKTGIVDGLETTLSAIYTDGYYEVGTHVILTYHIHTVEAQVINEEWLAAQDAEVQALIEDCMAQAMEFEYAERVKITEEAIGNLEGAGLTMCPIDTADLIEACAPMYDEFGTNNPAAAEWVAKLQSY